jgi:hypothetical protein
MKINSTSCGGEVNLDHRAFEEYEGPVKCFSCGTMLEIKTTKGVIGSINVLNALTQHSTEEISPNYS